MLSKARQSKVKRIPKLRFPEFSGEWRYSKLGKLGDFYRGHSYTAQDVQSTGLLVLRSSNIQSEKLIIDDDLQFVKKDCDKKIILSKNDLAICMANGSKRLVGKAGRYLGDYHGKVTVGAFCSIFRSKLILTQYLFQTSRYKKYLHIALAGTNINNLKNSELESFGFYFPVVQKEQQKIANFLGELDALIETLFAQKKALEYYKKGMIQRIFTQKVRFKDDNNKDFPKWEEKKLGEILKERKEYSTKGKGYTHISLTTKGVVPKSERYNRDFLVGDDEIKGYKITRLNDLCYNPANLKFGVISINKLGAGIFSPIYVTFEIVDQDIDFIGHYLIRNAFINKARRYEQGTVYERMAVHPSDFLRLGMPFPSIPEQKKIASFLDSIEKVIESKQYQISYAEEWKRGLMQQLFI